MLYIPLEMKKQRKNISAEPTKEELYTSRASIVLREKRISEIIELILIGYSRREIILHSNRKYRVGNATIYKLISDAQKIIEDEYKAQRPFEIAKHVARRERWLKSIGRKNKNASWMLLAIDDSLIKLKGLVDNKPTSFSNEEMETLRKVAQELSTELV